MSLRKRATQTNVLGTTNTVCKYITKISLFRSTLLMWDITYPFIGHVFPSLTTFWVSHKNLLMTEINETKFFGFRSVQLSSPFLWHTGQWVTATHHSKQRTGLEWLATVFQKKNSTEINIFTAHYRQFCALGKLLNWGITYQKREEREIKSTQHNKSAQIH